MPKLAHIHKASAGPPTVHVEGIIQTSVQRKKRFRGHGILTGGNERLNTSIPFKGSKCTKTTSYFFSGRVRQGSE